MGLSYVFIFLFFLFFVTRGLGVVVGEREKAYLLRVTSLEGFLKDVWVPKKAVSVSRARSEIGAVSLWSLPFGFARARLLPEEVAVLGFDDFLEVFHDFYLDLVGVLSTVPVRFVASVRGPMVGEFVDAGFVPFSYNGFRVFVPASGVEGFCGSFLVRANPDFVAAVPCRGRVYGSFTFAANGELFLWERGSVSRVICEDYTPIPPEEF